MTTFESFDAVAPIAPGTIERWRDRAPGGLVEVWEAQGSGLVGDGYVRVVDPDRAHQMLDGVLTMPPTAVPVLTTALADLVMYIAPVFHVARFRRGTIDQLAFESDQLYADLTDDQFLDGVLERQPYPAAADRLGVPGIDECFFYAPLLTIGGPEVEANLHRGGLWENLSLTVQMSGLPQPRGARG
ncbi:T6SS immunity protein Tdi1 domain-containing protein [Georgenia sp. Z1491]|uniref:T6SS immunity protein Tdi1 domain-containing protein n=1 Tax=Georgenia sp. Z1491 TaxID=3416707 RepID=UPI003CED6EF7